jgi:quercetin dioxygenase-like cupin family protein
MKRQRAAHAEQKAERLASFDDSHSRLKPRASRLLSLKTLKLSAALKRLRALTDEIRFYHFIEEKSFTAGVIAFRARKRRDAKRIKHRDKDVLCHVVKGRGRLSAGGKRLLLAPGTICHIPRGTPHDFAATRGELVLFYSLITTQ